MLFKWNNNNLKTGGKCGKCSTDLTYVYNEIFGYEAGQYQCKKCKIIWDRPVDLSQPTIIIRG